MSPDRMGASFGRAEHGGNSVGSRRGMYPDWEPRQGLRVGWEPRLE